MILRVFGDLMLISIDFTILFRHFFLSFCWDFEDLSITQDSGLTTMPNSSKFLKKCSTIFPVFGEVVKHVLSRLIYYFLCLNFWPSQISVIRICNVG